MKVLRILEKHTAAVSQKVASKGMSGGDEAKETCWVTLCKALWDMARRLDCVLRAMASNVVCTL